MQNIDYQQMKDIQKRNAATIVNVLPAKAFEETHIPGAINLPLEDADFIEHVRKVLDGKSAPVVVYCASSSCDASKKAAAKLAGAGFTNVMCYEGGAKEWNEKSNSARSAA